MTAPPPPASRSLHWFRTDLRLADNPALLAASEAPQTITVFIDETNPAHRKRGGASAWWLHHTLGELARNIAQKGGTLLFARGDSTLLIPQLAQALAVDHVTWSRRYGGAERESDAQIKRALGETGIRATSFNGALLYEPMEIRAQSGGPLRVFTPFWKACRAKRAPDQPLPAPPRLNGAPLSPEQRALFIVLDDLALLPTKPDWAGGLREAWQPGEASAWALLDAFIAGPLKGYADLRDRPDIPSTSRLSPALAHGNLSPRQIWHAVEAAQHAGDCPASQRDIDKFYAELGWREFSYHLLFHYPDLGRVNYQPRFDAFPWEENADALRAWQRGKTGYPIVDAGMRQLWQTGFMHNRVRMIVASFLIKHLMIDWRAGEAWFWDTLCDADPASNAASWQWVAGSGADAAPYFRIFNPITQGEKFDPDGHFVRHYVPELARLDAKVIHRPWEASPAARAAAGVSLGKTYPAPIIAHEAARERALAAFHGLRASDGEADT